MSRAAAIAALLCAHISVAADPVLQRDVFYNARMALREGRSTEALKLWLLRNSIEDQGIRATHDGEFRSVVWAALGEQGLCQDGFAKDQVGGAGLWPLAMHNWVLTSVAKGGAVDNPPPFDAYEAGLQQRFISLLDVLDVEELQSVSFFRSNCFSSTVYLLERGASPFGDLSDRQTSGPLLRKLLMHSLETLAKDKVQNLALIHARIFDLDLAMSELNARTARQDGRALGDTARAAGASDPAVKALQNRTEKVATLTSAQAGFLREALRWPARDWLALSQPRRLSLFAQARALALVDRPSPDLQPLILSIIDALLEKRAGAEVEGWVGWLEARKATGRRAVIIEGERGKRLLELDDVSGFRERSVVALHRGLAFLERGELREALISFAYAMANADSSREPVITMSLARRWVSYVLARYEVSEDLIATLKALVPKQEYNSVIEDLVWRAALNADVASFDRLVASARRGSSFDGRAARLRLLAQGNAGSLATQLRDAVETEPFFTVRFIRQLIEKLEAEEVDVRAANVPLVKLLVRVLDLVISQSKGSSAHARAADELLGRTQALLEGLKAFEPNTDGKARTLSPRHEAFAGNIRLAPTDALPWPFSAPEPEAPSAFTPIMLTPVEWRDRAGALVFGWRLSE